AASGVSGGGGGTNSVQVSPPSREVNRPLPLPPLVRLQGVRRACHMPAKSTFGADGSRQTSEAPASASRASTCFQDLKGSAKGSRGKPASASRASTCFQVLPPSVVR